ncbi:MAG: phosphate ABC transporter substrate-binding protein PstS [Terracidiphilus sp.]|jgi:phosphate transport system substrate-binding protein
MNLRSKALITAAAVLSTAALLAATGCKIAEEAKTDDDKIVTTSIRSLSASGSTAIEPLIDRWSKDYAQSHPVEVNYRPIGSGGGIENLRRGYGAFAASDAPLSDSQLQGLPAIVQIPVSTGPVCVVYNLPGLKSPLKLSGKTLAGIYASDIISWQDPAIASENPGAALPHAAIIVVHRADGSGTTSILTNFLSKASPTWAAKYGANISIKWPAGIGVNGSRAELSTVMGTPGTIGYLELTFARSSGVAVASIKNQAGEYVAPSPESAYAAVDASTDLLSKDLRASIVDPPATAKGAYPITGITFVLIPKDNTSTDGEQKALKDYLNYALSTGQDAAEELSYAKLPPAIQHQGQGLLAQLTDNGKPIR